MHLSKNSPALKSIPDWLCGNPARRLFAAGGRIVAIVCLVAAGALAALHRGAPPSAKGADPDAFHPASWPNDALTIAYLGHASLLMNYLGVRVLSDPSFFGRVGLNVAGLFTIGPKRRAFVPLTPAELPPLDLILITHAHMDHLDLPSLKTLPRSAVVVGCPGCRDLIEPLGFRDVRTLDWGESTVVKGLKITAMGARHWGARWPWEADRGYNSYVIDKDGCRMLLACDSALTPLFAALRDDPPLVAAFSIGAYDPWIRHHANPEQVWEMFQETGARYLIPIHWGTFKLSWEPMEEPIRRLIKDAGPDADRIVIREIGGVFQEPAAALAALSTVPARPQKRAR